MNREESPSEFAQLVVGHHTKGTICAGEVWNQMVNHATPSTVNEFVSKLTPELNRYFQRRVKSDLDPLDEKERAFLQWLHDWYEKHSGS